MAQQTINNGDTGLVARTGINNNFTELYALFDGEQYAILTNGGTSIRVGVRSNQGVMDITDTATGFAGAEGVDWHNIFKQS